jgi:outer membrane protein OmpA-like peptidoglycan-associated protein
LKARAKAVQDYMASAKLDPGIMTTHGFGKTQPVASNDTDAGRQKNRRVEIVVQDATQQETAEAAKTL